VAAAAAAEGEPELVRLVRSHLDRADKTVTVKGHRALLFAARVADMSETSSNAAAASRELDRLLDALLTTEREDPVDEIRRRRDELRAVAG